jgi:predicted TIM-barrel fold metal-dependent hydrolase
MPKLIDTNVSLGEWPFATVGLTSARSLTRHLEASGIGTALVSHLATVFNPEPDHGNQRLFKAVRNEPTLVPVPVINPVLADWRDLLDRYRDRHAIKAVKIYPNFHRFRLTSTAMDRLVAYTRDHGIRLIINIRMVDERHQYFALKINGVTLKSLADFSARHGDLKFLCLGLYRPEILELADQCGNFRTDFSFADWQFLLEELLTKLSVNRIFFGSHSPIMITQSIADQLTRSRLTPAKIRRIGHENAKAFFDL